ncbi:MAG: hypothetical protein M3158_05360, partial [Pseudomonadota bacterium]|nr:hypothetical protein [Pseudomonadota bacterium]
LTAALGDEVVAAAAEGRVIARLTPVGWERVRELRLALESLALLESRGWEAVADLWMSVGADYVEEPV